MAFYIINPFLFAFLLLLATPLPTFADASVGLISNICSQSNNPSLCVNALNSDTRSPNADLPTLCQISIELVQSDANKTSAMFDLVAEHVKDPTLRYQYERCSEFYRVSINNIDDAKDLLKSGSYRNLTGIAAAVRLSVDFVDGFLALSPDQPGKTRLFEADKNLYDLSSIFVVISRTLLNLKR